MTRSRILLVDDHELFREGVVNVINSQPDMEVVGQANDGLEALTMAAELRPDLILMDINMPLSNGLEAAGLIHARVPDSIIIMLTAYEEEEKLFDAIKAGAQGYLLKSSSSTKLVNGIRGVLDGEVSVPRKLARQFLAEFSKLSKQADNVVSEDATTNLTLRERDVLDIIATGASNQEIADTLEINLQTVKTHVSSILRKLQAKSRRQAAELGLKQGLVRRKQ